MKKFSDKSRHKLGAAALIAGVAALYAVMGHAGIGCPILYLTGISCAGCGMSRAWFAVLHGDLAAAAAYHPLFWIPPLAVIIWLLRGYIPQKAAKVLLWPGIALFIAVYIIRMADPSDDVVVFRPSAGLISQLWAHIAAYL